MNQIRLTRHVAMASFTLVACMAGSAHADEAFKVGLSVPLSGSGAIWGKAADWMCNRAAQEIKATGGVKVKGSTYNFECVAYDNKYTAAEATKVAQTLMNRDGVKVVQVMGTAPVLASQSLTERQGVMLFNYSWGMTSKGSKFPLTFSVMNSPVEIMPAMVQYVTKQHAQAKTIALLNVNDASGREVEAISRPLWEKAGIKVVSSDFYERGTTEFQPIATRLASFKADIVDLSSAPPADAGQVFKELAVLGYKGVKITDNGTGTDGIVTVGGAAANGVYMGAAIPFDGVAMGERQQKINAEARAAIGESLSLPSIAAYDAIYMLKAGMEKAQSVEPKDIAAALPTTHFKTFYGIDAGIGGKEVYGSNQQPILPVFITQIVDGKVVERARVDPKKN